MGEISLHVERLLALLEEVGSHRALTSDETDLIEEIVMRSQEVFRWTRKSDDELLLASARMGGISSFARRHQITPGMAYTRLYRLRGRERREMACHRRKG